jgi:hypothetical protein
MADKSMMAANVPYQFEYVTSTVSLLARANQGDGIVVHVVNDSDKKDRTQVVIYHNTGAGAVVATDSGAVDVVPSWQWGLGFTISASGEYWVRVRVSSEFMVPTVAFQRVEGGIWTAVARYKPGEFAVFSLSPTRKRLW